MSDFKKELEDLIEKLGPSNLTPESLGILIKELSNKDTNNNSNKNEEEVVAAKSNKAGKVTRALENEEYNTILKLLNNGFKYKNSEGKLSKFRPQPNVALALSLEATLGLRISDVLKLKVKHFNKSKLEILETKTNKLQYREIDAQITNYIRDYALEHKLGLDDYVINVKERWIQNRLQIISNHLGLTNIGTHSFRKLFATYVYNKSNGDIDLVKELLNHSSIVTTQIYLKTNQKKIDEFSSSVNFLFNQDPEKNDERQI